MYAITGSFPLLVENQSSMVYSTQQSVFGTDMVYYIYLLLKFTVPKYLIFTKTKVFLLQAYVTITDIGYRVQDLALLLTKSFKLFGFSIIRYLSFLTKVIPERVVRTKFDIFALIRTTMMIHTFQFLQQQNYYIMFCIAHLQFYIFRYRLHQWTQ